MSAVGFVAAFHVAPVGSFFVVVVLFGLLARDGLAGRYAAPRFCRVDSTVRRRLAALLAAARAPMVNR